MFKLFAYLIVIVALIVSCSDSSTISDEKRVASFEIEGMVCEMGCGASLRKGLYTTDAVDEVKVEYKEERKQNLIHVYYSSAKTNPQDMLEIIENLNEGQFAAKIVEDKLVSAVRGKSNSGSPSSSSNSDMNGVEATTGSFSLPNLTELINSLIY